MRPDPGSLAFRLVAAAVLWITAALAGGGILISTLFRDSVERGFDERLSVQLEALIGVGEIGAEGQLRLSRTPLDPRFDLPYSGWYWQISDAAGAPLLRSRSLWDQVLALPAAPAPGMWTTEIAGPSQTTLRVRLMDITLPEMPAQAPALRFAIGADRAELRREIRPFTLALAWSLGALGLGLAGAVAIQVWIGLRPLRRMRGALADIRTGRTDRMAGDWPTEVRPLVRELDALMEHNAAVVERARTHVGNLAHALKTPLAVLGNEMGRRGGPRAEAMERQVSTMRRWIDHYLARARAAATAAVLGARTPVAPVVEDLRRTLLRIHADRDLTIEATIPADAIFRGERQDLEEMLGNLMDNACKWTKFRVRVSAERSQSVLTLRIDDDGHGLPADRRSEAMRRGRRLDETAPGSGLGLAIVADIAELYSGALHLAESPLGGLRTELTLPAAEP